MQAVILCGGLGTRLRPMTLSIPKPMVPVRGRPFLEHQLRYLSRFGLTEVLILTGYKGEVVEEYFGDGSSLGIRVRYSREEEPLGTGGALVRATPLLEESFFLLYGDSFLPIDYGLAARFFAESGMPAMMVIYDNAAATSVPNNVGIDEKTSMVIDYVKNGVGMRYVEAGVLALKAEVLESMPQEGAFSMEKLLYPSLIERGEMAAYRSPERFYDIGDQRRLREFEAVCGRYVEQGERG